MSIKPKSQEVPTHEWIERVQRQCYFIDGRWFSGSHIKKRLEEAGASTTTVNRVLEQMTDAGLLEKEARRKGVINTMWYKRRRTGLNPIAMKWRPNSNEKLGITESHQFGVKPCGTYYTTSSDEARAAAYKESEHGA